MEVLNQIKTSKIPLKEVYAKEGDAKPTYKKGEAKKPFTPKTAAPKKPFGKGKPSTKNQKPENPVERFTFNSGKSKK
jgi:hypothetical protein